MASLRPSLRSTETYTETNFLRLFTADAEDRPEPLVTLEHFSYSAGDSGPGGWSCLTIVNAEAMSRKDAVFIARRYAAENSIPVIYECSADETD
jgi:hypothetical protein